MTLLMFVTRLNAGLRNANLVPRFQAIKLNLHNYTNKSKLLKARSYVFSTSKRSFFGIFRKPTIKQLKVKDNIPDEYNLIYRNTMDRYILLAQFFTSTTAFIVILFTIVQHDFKNYRLEFYDWNVTPRDTENEIYFYLTAFIGFVIVLQVLISRLPIRIYNLPQQRRYLFIRYGNIPFSTKKSSCTIGDVLPIPDNKKGLIPWGQGRYIVKHEHKIIMFEEYFRRPADLHIMLGVQRDPSVEDSKNE